MGNAEATVYNDTESDVIVSTYNYQDHLQWTSRLDYPLKPGEFAQVEAGPAVEGLKLRVTAGDRQSGVYNAAHDAIVNVSTLLEAKGGSLSGDDVKYIFRAAVEIFVIIANAQRSK